MLKRSLLGRSLLGIEGLKQHNQDALYLLALPVDAAIVIGKHIRRLLPIYDEAFISSSLCLLAMALVAECWPNVRNEVLLFNPLYIIVGVAYVASASRIVVRLYRKKALLTLKTTTSSAP
ncbi:hypothetical protein S7335_551 [Synechococcus sp. PCC 7335]|nr:hypothetical protein S7335_551 [Synechococcus sp. PCC 7335]